MFIVDYYLDEEEIGLDIVKCVRKIVFLMFIMICIVNYLKVLVNEFEGIDI